VVAATAWWLVPLLLLGRYSPPFLDWIESAAVTTAPGSVSEALRGTTQWLAGIVGGSGPRWPAAFAVLTSRSGVALGLAVALLGLGGLAHRRMPGRRFLLLGLLVGLALVTAGHVGTWTAPWAPAVQDLLDGPLAPLRNVHKFEPVVRLPLVLGLAHALAVVRRWRVTGAEWSRHIAVVVVASWLAASVAPAVYQGVGQPGAYTAVPGYWPQVATWLQEHPDGGRTLVLPGAAFATSVWGDPRDEPLQPYARTPWLVRDAVPLGSGGLSRVLTAVEERVASGQGGAELGTALASLGVTRVVLRNDLDWRATGAPNPLTVRQAVLSVPGATPVVHLGPPVGGSPRLDLVLDDGVDQPLPAIEVVALSSSPGLVRTVPAAAVPVVSGGPEAVLEAADETGQEFVLAGDRASLAAVGGTRPVVATDTLQRREAVFSTVRSAHGPVLRAGQPFAADRAVHDWLPASADESRESDFTLARDEGGRALASSSAATPAAFHPRDLGSAPTSAFDADAQTAWRSSSSVATGQWVGVRYPRPVQLPQRLSVVIDAAQGADVAAFAVTTDTGSRRTPVTAAETVPVAERSRYRVDVDVPPGPTRTLRLTALEVRGRATAPLVIRDVGAGVLPRVGTSLALPRLPDAVHAAQQTFSFAATDDRRPACVEGPDAIARCEPAAQVAGEQVAGLRRSFASTVAATYQAAGSVLPAGSPALERLLHVPGSLRVKASSRWSDDPLVRPDVVDDGDPRTYWAAAPDDEQPTLHLAWGTPRRVARLTLRTDPAVVGARATRVRVRIGGRVVDRAVPRSGVVELPPTRTSSLTLTVLSRTTVRSVRAGAVTAMPVVIGDIQVGRRTDLPALPDGATTGVPCGFGPQLAVDGHRLETRVVGTVGDVRLGRPLTWQACSSVRLGAGPHELASTASAEFVARSLSLRPRGTASPAAQVEAVTPSRWGSTDREVPLATADQARLLVVAENANAGWQATQDGARLRPVTVDGWSQGWVVPAGAHGAVHLRFTPERTFRVALLTGAALALALLLAALLTLPWPGRRRAAPAAVPAGPPPRVAGRRLSVGALTTGALVAAVLTLGPAGVLVAGWWAVLRWAGSGRRALAAAAVLAALAGATVLVAAAAPWPHPDATNRGGLAQVLSLVVVSGVLAWSLRTDGRPSRGSGAPPAGPDAPEPAS
jgi:arabinofuranan 3-O-arabinosyltransferase